MLANFYICIALIAFNIVVDSQPIRHAHLQQQMKESHNKRSIAKPVQNLSHKMTINSFDSPKGEVSKVQGPKLIIDPGFTGNGAFGSVQMINKNAITYNLNKKTIEQKKRIKVKIPSSTGIPLCLLPSTIAPDISGRHVNTLFSTQNWGNR